MQVLVFFFQAVPFLIAMGFGLLLPFLIWLFYWRFGAGLWAVALVYFLGVLFGENLPGIKLGIYLYPQDLIFVLIGAAALLRVLLLVKANLGIKMWFAFGAILFASFAEGLVRNGTGAGVDFRAYYYLWVGALYAMTFPMSVERVRSALVPFISLAFVTVFVVLYRWVVELVPISTLLPLNGSWSDMPYRVVPSMQALLLGQMFVLATFFYALHPWLASLRWLSAIWLFMVLGLQHRSVWLATLTGLSASLYINRYAVATRRGQGIITVGIFAVLLAVFSMSGKFGSVSETIGSSAYRAVTLSDTAGERLYSWQALVGKVVDGGVKSIIMGQSFGSDNSRYSGEELSAKKISYQAHNYYIQTLLRTGFLGLGLFLAGALWVMSGLFKLRADPEYGNAARALFVLLAAQLAYYVPYGADYLQAMLFGIAASFVMHVNRQADLVLAPADARRDMATAS
ncbi:MAG: O-antigen ligase family protein [Gammaproteobacteria bacterium]|nr:O-antigen ligase family protein [Gammaproteobacteria bacterium]